MLARGWIGRIMVAAVLVVVASASGCKSFTERFIALEVWKYERCFGHLPPGFVPPGAAPPAAAMPGRVCGQGAACQPACQPAAMGCNDCGGGMGVKGGMMEGSFSAAPGMPTPSGVTAGKPVVISD